MSLLSDNLGGDLSTHAAPLLYPSSSHLTPTTFCSTSSHGAPTKVVTHQARLPKLLPMEQARLLPARTLAAAPLPVS